MSIYDRLTSDLGRMDEREVLEPRVRAQIDPNIAAEQEMANRGMIGSGFQDFSRDNAANSRLFGGMGQTTVDLGGGLGTIPMPQISQEQINQILAGLNPTIFGYTPPSIDTGLEETGASQEVIEDVGDNTYDLGILDPTTGLVYEDEEDLPEGVVVGGGDGPAGTVIERYTTPPPPSMVSEAQAVIPPSVTPAPTPATDVVTGEDIPLITPQVNVPQESLTGLGSFFTTPQINQIVDPGYTPPSTSDMDKLLQLQRQSFRNFLVQPEAETAPTPAPDTGTTPSEGDMGSGYVGEGYDPRLDNERYDPRLDYDLYLMGSDPRGIAGTYTDPGGIQFTNQMYTAPSPQYTVGAPMDNLYGNLVFPDFSGVTSLVPFEERRQVLDTQRRFPPVLF